MTLFWRIGYLIGFMLVVKYLIETSEVYYVLVSVHYPPPLSHWVSDYGLAVVLIILIGRGFYREVTRGE